MSFLFLGARKQLQITFFVYELEVFFHSLNMIYRTNWFMAYSAQQQLKGTDHQSMFKNLYSKNEAYMQHFTEWFSDIGSHYCIIFLKQIELCPSVLSLRPTSVTFGR